MFKDHAIYRWIKFSKNIHLQVITLLHLTRIIPRNTLISEEGLMRSASWRRQSTFLRTVPVCYTYTPAARWGRHTASGHVEVSRVIFIRFHYLFLQLGNTTEQKRSAAAAAAADASVCCERLFFILREEATVQKGGKSGSDWAFMIKRVKRIQSVSQQSVIQFNITLHWTPAVTSCPLCSLRETDQVRCI